jgi:DNA-binding CsgD family transcriptional regulator
VVRTEEQHLAHYGILRRSGRYPWGSGGTQSKRNRDYLDTIKMLKDKGMTEKEIADGHGITIKEMREAKTIARSQQRLEEQSIARRHKEAGWSTSEIGRRMGKNESSVRALLADSEKDKKDTLETVSNLLKDNVAKKGMIDVGKGVSTQLGITKNKFDSAIAMVRHEGYELHNIKIQQIGTGKYTTMSVLAKPGTKLEFVQQNRKDIRQMNEYSDDHGRTFFKPEPPININSRRIRINYKEDGGDKADGVIYVRPGVKDLVMDSKHYGQVRIAVDGTHFLKGMAVYKEDLPKGVDIVFNTSQSTTVRKKDAMKKLEPDPDFPFGSVVRQIHDPKTGKVVSALNIVGVKEGSGVEGSWDKWARTLSSQMLSKQDPALAKQQLDMTFERRKKELDEISSLTNPTVRKDLLIKFADKTDAASVHLKAANLPRQANKVLLPVTSMNPKEVYAPSFRSGEQVSLIRYPHGGTFEIPQLKVNNRNSEAKKLLGPQTMDAIGIHPSVAHHLSGADFDGDTVLVIPNNRKLIKSTDPLEELKGFDPHSYKLPADSPIPRMKKGQQKQQEMGKISNLITDMTLGGANHEELSRAIRHSMVVIDAEKHGLNFRQSEKDHSIKSLKERYQGAKNAGAQTLISRKSSKKFIDERQERIPSRGGPFDPVTGKRVYEETGRTYIHRPTGEKRKYQDRVEKLALTDDAFTLVGKNPSRMEILYAEHSNRLKAMANGARKEAIPIKGREKSPSAAKVYGNEVATLNSKLNVAKKNAPRERQAQLLARTAVSQRRQANPNLDKADVKKIEQAELHTARQRTGAHKDMIKISPKEWEAIQAGALSPTKLGEILTHSDVDTVRHLALPKHAPKMTSTKMRRAKAMLAQGFTQQDVADQLGVSLSTLKVTLSE